VPDSNIHQTLLDAAADAARFSLAPYSATNVGAAALCADGSIITGTNLETAAWVPGLHAETSVIAQWQLRGCPDVTHLVVVAINPTRPLPPCGMCRQLLIEHLGPELKVWTKDGYVTLETLLPLAFGAKDLS
jgi:cytidine deaminase